MMQSLNVTVPNFAEQMWVQLWFWGELGSGSTPSLPKNTISPPIAGLDSPPSTHCSLAAGSFGTCGRCLREALLLRISRALPLEQLMCLSLSSRNHKPLGAGSGDRLPWAHPTPQYCSVL